MCGIVGMVSTTHSGFDWKQRDIFKELLYVDLLRGEDSTGAFLVKKNGNVEFLKDAKPAFETLTSKAYDEFSTTLFQAGYMAVGHNRKATKGTITDENAHPFVEDKTILVHNGTIRDHEKLTEEVVTVDSHAILHSINERGAKTTLADINGAYALVWYNATDKKLYLARNSERPLYIANTPGCWYFASEKTMLAWVLERNQITVKDWTFLEPKYIYNFDLTKQAQKMNIQAIPEKKIAIVVPTNQTSKANAIIPWNKRRHRDQSQTPREQIAQLVQDLNKKPVTEPTIIKAQKPKSLEHSPTLFRTGAQCTISGHNAVTMSEGTNTEFIGYVHGTLYERDEVPVRVFFRKTEEELFQKLLKSPQDIFTATILQVHSKNGVLRCLHLHNAVPLVSTMDITGEEILPDDFMILNIACKVCKKPIPWSDIPKSEIKIWRLVDSVICVCPNCIEKEAATC